MWAIEFLPMFAVIATGGKQYVVTPGQVLNVELLEHDAGTSFTLDQVLLVVDDKKVNFGEPFIDGAKVKATVVRHGRHAKVTGVKFHNKVRYRRKFGHRQHFTTIKIDSIV